jgi:hypothetical protein
MRLSERRVRCEDFVDRSMCGPRLGAGISYLVFHSHRDRERFLILLSMHWITPEANLDFEEKFEFDPREELRREFESGLTVRIRMTKPHRMKLGREAFERERTEL